MCCVMLTAFVGNWGAAENVWNLSVVECKWELRHTPSCYHTILCHHTIHVPPVPVIDYTTHLCIISPFKIKLDISHWDSKLWAKVLNTKWLFTNYTTQSKNLKIREMFNMRSESRVVSDIVRQSSDTKPSDRKYRLVPLTSAKFLRVADSWHKHTHNCCIALFPGLPRWVSARRNLLLDFIVQGKMQTQQPSGWTSLHPD